ncbi:MAG TPA: VWA domain-containing protein [Pyrinomonadaceae bacterium]|nr:VWA domain-containing protein [Pyrinomonadaceae bacterium]
MKSISSHRLKQLAIVILLALLAAPAVLAQDVADTIKIRTRVVFVDALVKDKRTGIPISDLKRENFELLDDGKPRTISYFSGDGQARKPLALILILDISDDGAGRFLKREEVRTAIVAELAKLPPGDEVAIMALNTNRVDDKSAAIRDGHALWLTDFTRDPAQIEKALARIPALVTEPSPEEKEAARQNSDKADSHGSMTINASTDGGAGQPDGARPKADEVLETETIKGKNGAVITRTIKKDGTVNVARTSSSGKLNVVLNNVYDMAAATRDATHFVEEKRANSQAAIVWVSDGIAPIFKEDVGATEQILIRQNAIFNSMNVDMKTIYKFLVPMGQPLIGWTGISLAGSARRLAQESGGESVHVGRARDYGAGLARVIGNLNARYSLGFTLAEDEKDDGRMHQLTLRVTATDAKGKQKRLDVSSRRGYYVPKTETADALLK